SDGRLLSRFGTGIHLTDAVTAQHNNCEHPQCGPERYLQAVQSTDNDGKNPMPFLQQEDSRYQIENERQHGYRTEKNVHPNERLKKLLGRWSCALLGFPHLRVREGRVHDEIMHKQEASPC